MIRLLANPEGGRGRVRRRLDELRHLASAAGVELSLSRDAADLTAQARRAVEDGCQRLLVAGGDGTVHHAVQGLAGSDCALAVVPLGSGNDFVGSLGGPTELAAAMEHAVRGEIRSIDLVRVEERFFACVGGLGFDSAANEVANRVRRLRGQWIYLYSVLHTLATFRAPRLRIQYEGGSFHGEALMVAIANAPRYGGGMRIAPAARMDDGLLDLVIIKKVALPAFLRVFPKVYKGTHVDHPAILQAKSPWVHVRPDRDLPAYGDGERLMTVGGQGARFEVVPGALKVVAGKV